MALVKILAIAFAGLTAAPLAAAGMTLQQAYAQCRARYAHMQDIPGTGNPVREATIEGCVRETMSRQPQPGPASRSPARTRSSPER
jgi:hypothetical protein